MSKSASRPRLYTPRRSRVVAPRVDAEVVGQATESIARFFGTGTYLLIQTVVVLVWIALNVSAVSLRWDPYPFILLNLAFLHPGRLRGAADPAGPEPPGEPRPRHGRRGSPTSRGDQGRHRVPGP